MDTKAYDAGLPCKNPNCKSNGRPHPNCHCYSHMAEGGRIDVCASNSRHDSGCEYYAEGGITGLEPVPEENLSQSSNLEPVPSENMLEPVPEENLSGEDSNKYNTTGQQILTGVEGAGKGFAGPIATGLELGAHKLGIDSLLGIDTSAEAQKGREATNPGIHTATELAGLGAGLLTGTGEAGLIAKGANALEHVLPAAMSKVGAGVVKGFVENAAIQGGDEISKALLDQGDPNAATSSYIMHMGAAGLMGAVTGGVFGKIGKSASKGLEAIENQKMGAKAQGFLAGIGDASTGVKIDEALRSAKDLKSPNFDLSMYKKGLEAHAEIQDALHGTVSKKIVDTITKGVSTSIGTVVGSVTGGIPGAMAGSAIGNLVGDAITPSVEKIVDKAITKGNKYVYPAMVKALSTGETRGLWNALDYTNKLSQGAAKGIKAVGSLFGEAEQQGANAYVNEPEREKLRKFIEEGGVDKQIDNTLQQQNQSDQPIQAFAKGGKVDHNPQEPNTLATHFPNQAMMLSASKARVSNYLNSVRPTQPTKLSFDAHIKDHAAEKSYNNALDIANQPLSVIGHIHSGTLVPDHMKHMSQMYPEVYDHLSKKINEKVVESQMKGHMPSYKIRQGLSLFLRTPMDSSFTPQAIMAAQPNPAPQPPKDTNGRMKGGKATANSMNKRDKSYETGTQAAESDRVTRD